MTNELPKNAEIKNTISIQKCESRVLKSGANIDTCSEQNVTPLMSAAAADEIDIVRLLLNHGADASIQDCIGATALDTAIEKGSDDKIVELLESWSRDRNII